MEAPRHLVFYTSTNSEGKRDATGAFVPCARKYAEINDGAVLVPVDCSKPTMSARLNQVKKALDRYNLERLFSIAFFCHGWSSGIQHGLTNTVLKKDKDLVEQLLAADFINLYACSTGKDPTGGFAAQLAHTSINQVFAHKTDGHCAYNPNIIIFDDKGHVLHESSPSKSGFKDLATRLKKDDYFTYRRVWFGWEGL